MHNDIDSNDEAHVPSKQTHTNTRCEKVLYQQQQQYQL